MGMSTHVVGFVEPDEDYKAKVAAWKACKKAKITAPPELERLFDGNEPQDAGMEVNIEAATRRYDGGHREREGYDVDVTALPQGVKIVRFYNSW